ncbi:MAG: zinc-binding protein [Nitrospira sp.]|nr:zinc-binding protein [Nitrospira sp.]
MIITLFLATSLILPSCAQKAEKVAEVKKLKVVTTLFPLYDFAKTIGGKNVEVTLLLPPGVEPHSYEPKPADILKIHEADLFVYTGRFMEPWVEDILKGIRSQRLLIIDSSRGVMLMEEKAERHEHRSGIDPHIWLDLSNAEKMVDNILDGMTRKDPANTAFYQNNAEEYKKKLEVLDRRFKNLFPTCKKKIFVHGGHSSFGYFAKRYHLRYLSAYKGFSPDAEPAARDMVGLTRKIKEYGLMHIYYEELVTPKVAETIARETGSKLLMLHAAHNITREDIEKGITFLSLMERNEENLKIGLQCQ